MSAGETIERVHRLVAQAAGQLSFAIETKKLSRSYLEGAADRLEAAARDIRSVLPPPGGGSKVENPPTKGIDNGTAD